MIGVGVMEMQSLTFHEDNEKQDCAAGIVL